MKSQIYDMLGQWRDAMYNQQFANDIDRQEELLKLLFDQHEELLAILSDPETRL